MDQFVPTQVPERQCQVQTELDALDRRETATLLSHGAKCLWSVGVAQVMEVAEALGDGAHRRARFPIARLRSVGQLHHVIIVTGGVVSPSLEHVQQAVIASGDGLERLNAAELALITAFVPKGLAVDHLDRAVRSQDVSGQPHFAVGAAADAAKEFVVGNDGLGQEVGDGSGCQPTTRL